MLRILEKIICHTVSRKPKGERNTLYRICLESKFLYVATRSIEWMDWESDVSIVAYQSHLEAKQTYSVLNHF